MKKLKNKKAFILPYALFFMIFVLTIVSSSLAMITSNINITKANFRQLEDEIMVSQVKEYLIKGGTDSNVAYGIARERGYFLNSQTLEGVSHYSYELYNNYNNVILYLEIEDGKVIYCLPHAKE